VFIGRQPELEDLSRLYDTGKFQCVIIYGRRRVGKTALISEFIKDKDAIFFTGRETNAKENLEGLSRSIFRFSNGLPGASPIYASYEAALEAIFLLAEKRRVIFVIDEYPYLAAGYNGISSLLQVYIDKYKDNSKLFLILCGSSLSFMENQVLGYQSPLYGRRTAQIKVLPFDYRQTGEYFADRYNPADTALLYGVTGGIPLYMSLMEQGLSVDENIKRNFLSPSGYMYEEPSNLIKQECREPAQYNAIIKAIAGGASRLSSIANKVGLETALCSSYLSKLIAIGIVSKEGPFRENASKKTIYRLVDSMFRFWYRFIPDCISMIQQREADLAYTLIREQLPAFIGTVFEDMCKQYLWRQNATNQTPFLFTDAGRWWGNHPIKRAECEIDIIADNKTDGLFAECKWTSEPVGTDVLSTLIESSELFHYRKKYYYLFARTGFTQTLVSEADRLGNVFLISFDDF